MGYYEKEDIRRAIIDAHYEIENGYAPAPPGSQPPGTGLAIGGVALAAGGMLLSRRFRYVMQVILHGPMAFCVLFCVSFMTSVFHFAPTDYAADFETMLKQLAKICLWIALIGSVIWTTIYAMVRTRAKWRAL